VAHQGFVLRTSFVPEKAVLNEKVKNKKLYPQKKKED
jgi:hypothetical protein